MIRKLVNMHVRVSEVVGCCRQCCLLAIAVGSHFWRSHDKTRHLKVEGVVHMHPRQYSVKAHI